MIIKKVDKILNVCSFSFFNWDKINPIKGNNPNDPIDTFKKNNIIFGENGNGKSNLINIFKSLNGQDIELEKHWDYLSEKQEIKLILDDNSENLLINSVWSNNVLHDKFIVFDKHFVDKYVHSLGPDNRDSSLRKQERGRNIIYLGNFASYNNEIDKIDTLKNTIFEKNEVYLKEKESEINTIISNKNITIEELRENKSKIEKLKESDLQNRKNRLEKEEKKLNKISNALKEKNKIEELLFLDEIKTSFSLIAKMIEEGEEKEIEIDPPEIFSFTISKGVQVTLSKIYHKKDFIKTGLSLLDSKKGICPFCEQKIKNGDYIQIIKDYKKMFDQSFAEEERNIKILLSDYRRVLEGIRDLQASTKNKNIMKQIIQFISIDKELPDVFISDEDRDVIKNELNLKKEKEKNVLDEIRGSKVTQIRGIIEKINKLTKKYNDLAKDVNKKIKQLKKDMVEGKLEVQKSNIVQDISELDKDILFIESKKSIEGYFEILRNYENNKKVVGSLEKLFTLLKNKIIDEFNNFVSNYFSLIKSFVKEISPTMDIFEIEGESRYDRRSREATQCGFCIKYKGKECTRSLSEGEKQVIALSFFFAQLKKENNKKKIIVFDDPITSFDAGKRKSTAEVTQRETNDFGQLFIFTCDPLFREFCLNQFSNRNFYYIFKTKGSSSLHYVPKKRETIYDSFETDFKNIDNINGSNENVVIFGQKLRFCLETKIKEDYFGYSQDNLSNMIEQVTSKGKSKFDKLIDNKDMILQIYKYCNTGGLAHYPKDGSTSWNELKDKVKQYLDLDL